MPELFPGGPGYPGLLARVPSPPDPLFLDGEVLPGDAVAVALVGSRQPTAYGLWAASRLAGGLAAAGVTVVSGMARGIDQAAHRAALEAGGRTLGVLGCGLDFDYPRGSLPFRARVARQGAVLTEYPAGTGPANFHFPRRNRIISGLSLAVVVVEAARKSGALVTARWALDQGREVLAVPGRIDSALSAGPLALLRDGAAPAASAEDILSHLGLAGLLATSPGEGSAEPRPAGPDRGPGERDLPRDGGPLSEALAGGPRRAEELAEAWGRPMGETLAELTRLELAGTVRRLPGGSYCRI